MPTDVGQIIGQMGAKAAQVFSSKWPDVRQYAEKEFADFANSVAMIDEMYSKGEITEERAQAHMRMQINSMIPVFIAIEGISLLMAEEAINAALSVVSGVINTAIGFKLLPT